MRPTLSLIRREFTAFFYSPIAYVVLGVFLAVTGHLFYLSLTLLTARGPKGITYPMELFVNSVPFWLVFLFIPPLLTMRLFAEERSTGTLEMLLTAPIRDWQVVFAKFFACYAFYVLMWIPTLVYLPVLLDVYVTNTDGESTWRSWNIYATNDPWPVVSTYLGLALVGAMFLAMGLLISSFVKSQMVAALISLFVGLVFIVGGIWRPDMDMSDTPYQVLSFFTVPLHFERNFGRGLVDTRNLILYCSVAILCLFLTVRSLESRRWR